MVRKNNSPGLQLVTQGGLVVNVIGYLFFKFTVIIIRFVIIYQVIFVGLLAVPVGSLLFLAHVVRSIFFKKKTSMLSCLLNFQESGAIWVSNQSLC